MNIIAADVGGTKTWIVVANANTPGEVLYEARYSSGDFDSFEPLLQTFIEESGCDNSQLKLLSLALPGVVNGSEAKLTNLPWTISKNVLQEKFGVEQIHFMNDFQAAALGIAHLKPEDIVCLNQGVH